MKPNHEGKIKKRQNCKLNGGGVFIEMINMEQINEAYERLLKGDVKYLFIIDMGSLKN